MKEGFIAASANIQELDPALAEFPIVRTTINNAELKTALSNSIGFGGSNSTLVFRRL